jgi:hypothetical protein
VPRLVQIPRHLLHVQFDELTEHGVPGEAQRRLRKLLADLPLVPDAAHSAQLIGPPEVTLPCLAVLARHVGQGLRDHNLTFAHDRARLNAERGKMIFMAGAELASVVAAGDQRPSRETVVFVVDATPAVVDLVLDRQAAGLASFIATPEPLPRLALWHIVEL